MTMVFASESPQQKRFSVAVAAEVFRELPLLRQLKPRAGSILDAAACGLSALLHLVPMASWLRFIKHLEHGGLSEAVSEQIILKPLRSFAVHGINLSDRISLLQDHYVLALKSFPPSILSSLLNGEEIEIGTLRGRKFGRYTLLLSPPRHCSREGELAFALIAKDGFELARLTFTLASDYPGGIGRTLVIGGLQGPSSFFGPTTKERIIEATRDLGGLRPKMAVFVAASALACSLGATHLFGVSNKTHTINADAPWQRKRRQADYDEFWLERGGCRVDNGFLIPVGVTPRAGCAARNRYRHEVVALVQSWLGAA